MIQAQICEDDSVTEDQRKKYQHFDIVPRLSPEHGGPEPVDIDRPLTPMEEDMLDVEAANDVVLREKIRVGSVPTVTTIYRYTASAICIIF